MNVNNFRTRLLIYIVLLVSLLFFSQILSERFAQENMTAYISNAINGILALEIFFGLNRLDGALFFKLFWPIYLMRLGVFIVFTFIYALLNREVMFSFFVSFLVYYFTWLFADIYVLMHVDDKNK